MKGILLAGGSGTRLHPMTMATSKQLLPVYDKPMAYYPLSVLMLSGIRDILIISTPVDLPMFRRLLGDGAHLGCRFSYAEQPSPDGLAQAFVIGAEWLAGEACALVLGDNMIFGDHLSQVFQATARRKTGATVFAYQVRDPERYGVVSFDEGGKATEIVEKPTAPLSNWAVIGLYFYDNRVTEFARAIKPSPRGELEITDLNRVYLEEGTLAVERLGRAARGWMRAPRIACCRLRPSCKPSSLAKACWWAARRRSPTGWASSMRPRCAPALWPCARLNWAGCCWKSPTECTHEVRAFGDSGRHPVQPGPLWRRQGVLLRDLDRQGHGGCRHRSAVRAGQPQHVSGQGVLRGLHCQLDPHAQGKLVRCVKGAIWDVAVDARRGSRTFGRHVAAELSAANWQQLWVPPGFLHGFVTLEPDSEVVYKTTGYYDKDSERGIMWNDPDLALPWPVTDVQLSDKDKVLPGWAEMPAWFRV